MGYLKSFALLALASAGVVGSAKPSANAPGILGLRGLVNGTIPLSTEPESYWTTPAPPPANPPQDRPRTPAPARPRTPAPAQPRTPAPARPGTPTPAQPANATPSQTDDWAWTSFLTQDWYYAILGGVGGIALLAFAKGLQDRSRRNDIEMGPMDLRYPPDTTNFVANTVEDLVRAADSQSQHSTEERAVLYNPGRAPKSSRLGDQTSTTQLPLPSAPPFHLLNQDQLPLNDGQSSSRQPASNSGQGLALSLPSQLRRINLEALTLELGASVGFVVSPQASTQQSASENPDYAPPASASSRTRTRTRTPSTTPSRSSSRTPSVESVQYHDIEPGPPPQYL